MGRAFFLMTELRNCVPVLNGQSACSCTYQREIISVFLHNVKSYSWFFLTTQN